MERPILFSGDMVRAILEGRKTQTRQVVKFKSSNSFEWKQAVKISNDYSWIFWSDYREENIELTSKAYHLGEGIKCPYGQPGDILWVREKWYQITNINLDPGQIIYEADGWESKDDDWNFKWHPSIHMPKWASRITLEIVNVRVEKIQDITDEDAIAEGMLIFDNEWQMKNFPDYKFAYEEYLLKNDGNIAPPIGKTPRQRFMKVWNSINGKKYPWESNPWVWCIEFKRIN